MMARNMRTSARKRICRTAFSSRTVRKARQAVQRCCSGICPRRCRVNSKESNGVVREQVFRKKIAEIKGFQAKSKRAETPKFNRGRRFAIRCFGDCSARDHIALIQKLIRSTAIAARASTIQIRFSRASVRATSRCARANGLATTAVWGCCFLTTVGCGTGRAMASGIKVELA